MVVFLGLFPVPIHYFVLPIPGKQIDGDDPFVDGDAHAEERYRNDMLFHGLPRPAVVDRVEKAVLATGDELRFEVDPKAACIDIKAMAADSSAAITLILRLFTSLLFTRFSPADGSGRPVRAATARPDVP